MQVKKKHRLVWLALTVWTITPACLFLGGSGPRVVNHPQPDVFVNQAGFDETLCPMQDGRQVCPPESEPAALGCDEIRLAGDLLGGLRPAYPIRVCLAGKPGAPTPPENEFVFREGCMLPRFIRYLIIRENKLEVIDSQDALRQVYAPIENNLEALSYALAASGLGVRYGLQTEKGLRYFVDEMQDTFVRQTEQGFQVHLYDYQLCGCGPHGTYAVDLLITPDGEIEEIAREKVFEDPAEDGLCVD